MFSPLNPQQVASKSSGIWALGVGELVGAGNVGIQQPPAALKIIQENNHENNFCSSCSQVAETEKNPPEMLETRFDLWVGKISWRRAWQPTLLFLPGKPHGQRSLAGYSPWGCKELDTTEVTNTFTNTSY